MKPKFNVGDRVVRIYNDPRNKLYQSLQVGTVWTVEAHDENGLGDLKLQEFPHRVQSERFVLEEVYNSPLYKALK